ncbi:zinc finger MYM-type protein 1-like protein [Tanacetum coccineum]
MCCTTPISKECESSQGYITENISKECLSSYKEYQQAWVLQSINEIGTKADIESKQAMSTKALDSKHDMSTAGKKTDIESKQDIMWDVNAVTGRYLSTDFVVSDAKLVDFYSIEPTNNKYLIDVAGYVTNVGRTTHQKLGLRNLDFYLANHKLLTFYVVIPLTPHSYKLYLSSSSSTMIFDDVDIPALKTLRNENSGVESKNPSLPVDHSQPKEGTLENLLMWARNQKNDVMIESVRTKKGWNFPSCGGKSYEKGVAQKLGKFWCDACNMPVDCPILRGPILVGGEAPKFYILLMILMLTMGGVHGGYDSDDINDTNLENTHNDDGIDETNTNNVDVNNPNTNVHHVNIFDPRNWDGLSSDMIKALVEGEHVRCITSDEIHIHYLGHSIQNELIQLLALGIKSQIIQNIKQAKYFSVILDCTPDTSHQEQMSLILRYVNEASTCVTVEESFLGFLSVDDMTGQELFDVTHDELKSLDLDFYDVLGQGYDNGSNIKGKHQGVKKKVLDINPRAFYPPCGCHSLNLTLCDIVSSCGKATDFFRVIQRIYTMFANSSKRWLILKNNVKGLTLKPLSITRYESRVESLKAIRYRVLEIREVLLQVAKTDNDFKIKSKSKSLSTNELGDFEFLVSTVIWFDILSAVNLVSKKLQTDDMLIDVAIKEVEGLIVRFRSIKTLILH